MIFKIQNHSSKVSSYTIFSFPIPFFTSFFPGFPISHSSSTLIYPPTFYLFTFSSPQSYLWKPRSDRLISCFWFLAFLPPFSFFINSFLPPFFSSSSFLIRFSLYSFALLSSCLHHNLLSPLFFHFIFFFPSSLSSFFLVFSFFLHCIKRFVSIFIIVVFAWFLPT